MASVNMNDIFIAEETDLAKHPKVLKYLFNGGNSTKDVQSAFHDVEIKQEEIDYPQPTEEGEDIEYKLFPDVKKEEIETAEDVECEDSGVYIIHVQLKEEPSVISYVNVKQTRRKKCNNALKHLNVSKTAYGKTVREYFEAECDFCSKKLHRRKALTKHIDKHVRQQTCQACRVVFATHTHLRHHLINVHNEDVDRPYACSVCDKRFMQKGHCKRHQATHTDARPYACDLCDKRYKRSSNLRIHKVTHTSERPYACEICNKRFQRKESVRMHRFTHNRHKSDGNPCRSNVIITTLECNVCNKWFKSRNSLRKHLIIHTDERPFLCSFCTMRFGRKDQLIYHEQTHTNERPHVCDVCGKSFRRRCSLKKHTRVHAKERPYVCDVCYKSFTQIVSLKCHKLVHVDQFPYVCDVCVKGYNHKGNLTKHQKTHH